MNDNIREEIAQAIFDRSHTPHDPLSLGDYDIDKLADALMPLVARIQAQALREAADGLPLYYRTGGPVTWLRARADRLEQGDPS